MKLWMDVGLSFCVLEITGVGLIVIGLLGLFIRKNLLVMLMCIELMLNGVNLSFVGFAKTLQSVHGELMQLFVMTVAAAEGAVGLALMIVLFRQRRSVTTDALEERI